MSGVIGRGRARSLSVQVAALLADVKRRTTPGPPRTTEPFEWFGMIKDGPRDASPPEVIEAVLAQGFGC